MSINRIIEDIKMRGMDLRVVLAVDPDTNLIRVIQYDGNGLVQRISQGDAAIALYGKAKADAVGMRELFTAEVSEPGEPETESTPTETTEPDDSYGYGDDHTDFMGQLRSNY